MLLARALRASALAASAASVARRPLQLRPPVPGPWPSLGSGPVASASLARPFTRSLWVLRGERPRSGGILRGGGGSPSVSCSCGGLHTEGDKAFAEFLTDEIKEEKKIQKHKALPKMSGGWELQVQGIEAKLEQKVAGETITVSFSINNSISSSFGEPSEEEQKPGEEEEPDITSTPDFTVRVTKDDTKQTLVLECHYPEGEVGPDEEAENDIFSIRDVRFQLSGKPDAEEKSYSLATDSLDWTLYDHLMDFLADRGVDNTFADELVELSTALEHQEYIRFLEELKRFVKCQ